MATELLIRSVNDVIKVIGDINEIWNSANRAITIDEFKKMILVTKQAIETKSENITDIAFLSLGAAALGLVYHYSDMDIDKFADFLVDKHKKYGSEPIFESDTIGIVLRILSKINRFKNLIEHNDLQFITYDTEDTLKDILGYCILGYYFVQVKNSSSNKKN
jgi:hypothetical protein